MEAVMGGLVFVIVLVALWVGLAKHWRKVGQRRPVIYAGMVSFVFAGLTGAGTDGAFSESAAASAPAASTVELKASPAPPEPADKAKPPQSLTRKTMTSTTFGCATPEAFKDASSYWANDEKTLLEQTFDDGSCVLLKKGEPVILVDVKFMDYAVVRRPDTTEKWVTFTSALE